MTYPIILAHGVCRFDILWSGPLKLDNADDNSQDKYHYFKGVRSMLISKGYSVFHSNVPWAASVNQRAAELLRNIESAMEIAGKEKVNIIAHSMGGLDARHMLFNFREGKKIHDKVASLTTISTPHHGTPFADWGLANLPLVIPIVSKIGLDLAALEDLQTGECKKFNQNPDVIEFENNCSKTIDFRTYAGRQNIWGCMDALKGSYFIIDKKEGENDGLVSVKSAKWDNKYFKRYFDNADHLNELGWWDPGQLLAGEGPVELLERIHGLYADIAKELP